MTINEQIKVLVGEVDIEESIENEARLKAIEALDDRNYQMAEIWAAIAKDQYIKVEKLGLRLEDLRASQDAGLPVDASAFFIEGVEL